MKRPTLSGRILKIGAMFITCSVMLGTPAFADVSSHKKTPSKREREPNVFERIHNFVAKLVDTLDRIEPSDDGFGLHSRSVYDRDSMDHRPKRQAASNPNRDDDRVEYRRPVPRTYERRDSTTYPAWNEPNHSGLAPEMKFPSIRDRPDSNDVGRGKESVRDFKPIPPIPGEEIQMEPKPEQRKLKQEETTRFPADAKREEPSKLAAPEHTTTAPKADVPVATLANKPDRVKSPYPPYRELDVTGLPPGSLVKDPSTGQMFRLPR